MSSGDPGPADQEEPGLTGKRAWIYPIVAWTITLAMATILWQSFFHPYPFGVGEREEATLISSVEGAERKARWFDLVVQRGNGEQVPIRVSDRGDFSGKEPGDAVEIYRADDRWHTIRYDGWTRRAWLIPVVGVLGAGTMAQTWNLPIVRRLRGRRSPPD